MVYSEKFNPQGDLAIVKPHFLADYICKSRFQ